MLPKPSVVLQVKLMPEDYSEAAAAEIKRSFIYLAQSLVSEVPEGERADGNVMRLSIRLMRSYWDPGDQASQELWHESFMPWLRNLTRNISTAMHNFNTVLHPLGSGNVQYSWVDYDFGSNALLRVKVDGENRLPADAPMWADKVRTLMGQGVFGENVALIRMPSLSSLEAQQQAAVAQQAAAAEEAAAAQQAALADAEADDAAGASGGVLDASAQDECAESSCAFAESSALDYHLWDVVYKSGAVVEFDSSRC